MSSIGINFRATAGFVTDGAGETYCTGDAYPVTRGGWTFGWEDAGVQTRDRNSTVDPRLAGMNFQATSGKRFRIDLPAAGSYNVRVAAGDASSNNASAFDIKDNATVLFSTTGTILGGHFKDATNVDRTTAAWPGSNVAQTVSFASTIFRLVTTTASDDTIAHVFVEQAAVGGGRNLLGDGTLVGAGPLLGEGLLIVKG